MSQNFNPLKILNSKEKKRIEYLLKEQFGILNVPGLIVRRGKERLFLFSGSFDDNMIKSLEKTVIIERIGVYFAKIIENRNGEDEIRLSIEGTQILGEKATKNVFNINDVQVEMWMKGQQLDIKSEEKGFLIIKHREDFLGTGKASEDKIGNFIPKSRRLKEKS